MSRPHQTWTTAQRQRQAEICREIQPYLNSTGPKTTKGKLRSRMNALKHGEYSPPLVDRRTSRRNAAYVIKKTLLQTMGQDLDLLTREQFEADIEAFEEKNRERTE